MHRTVIKIRDKAVSCQRRHLHSGEEFGPVGVAVSIMSGFALLFFAFSGLWMYVRMWASRKSRGLGGTFWR